MRALGFDVKKADVIKIVHDVDPSNEGTVVYEQFLEIMVNLSVFVPFLDLLISLPVVN